MIRFTRWDLTMLAENLTGLKNKSLGPVVSGTNVIKLLSNAEPVKLNFVLLGQAALEAKPCETAVC